MQDVNAWKTQISETTSGVSCDLHLEMWSPTHPVSVQTPMITCCYIQTGCTVMSLQREILHYFSAGGALCKKYFYTSFDMITGTGLKPPGGPRGRSAGVPWCAYVMSLLTLWLFHSHGFPGCSLLCQQPARHRGWGRRSTKIKHDLNFEHVSVLNSDPQTHTPNTHTCFLGFRVSSEHLGC